MTKKQINLAIERITALRDGKTLQGKLSNGLWVTIGYPMDRTLRYLASDRVRIEPEPSVRWIVTFEGGHEAVYHDAASANSIFANNQNCIDIRKFVEAPPEEQQ